MFPLSLAYQVEDMVLLLAIVLFAQCIYACLLYKFLIEADWPICDFSAVSPL